MAPVRRSPAEPARSLPEAPKRSGGGGRHRPASHREPGRSRWAGVVALSVLGGAAVLAAVIMHPAEHPASKAVETPGPSDTRSDDTCRGGAPECIPGTLLAAASGQSSPVVALTPDALTPDAGTQDVATAAEPVRARYPAERDAGRSDRTTVWAGPDRAGTPVQRHRGH